MWPRFLVRSFRFGLLKFFFDDAPVLTMTKLVRRRKAVRPDPMRRPAQPHNQLEAELQALLQDNPDGSLEDVVKDLKDGGSDSDTRTAIKKRVRVIKNRLAAKRSREHARNYVVQLESTLSALAAHNEFLARRLELVEAENDNLRRGLPVRSTSPSSSMQGPASASPCAPPCGSEGTNNHWKEPCGEPAVLPLSSLQLDGFFLLLVAFLSTMAVLPPCAASIPRPWCDRLPARGLHPPRPTTARAATRCRHPPRWGRRSTRSLRRAGHLHCPSHAGRLRVTKPCGVSKAST